MPIGNKRPRGLLLFGFRLPIWLYHMHLGWILGERFLLLTHIGRKSGSTHQTVIEVVGHEKSTDIYYVVAGFGRSSDWLLNLQKNPNVTVTVGQRTFSAQAAMLSEYDGAKKLQDYAILHPIAFRELSTILTGKAIEPTDENCYQFVQDMPVVAFLPHKS